jgi:hypothetical protein
MGENCGIYELSLADAITFPGPWWKIGGLLRSHVNLGGRAEIPEPDAHTEVPAAEKAGLRCGADVPEPCSATSTEVRERLALPKGGVDITNMEYRELNREMAHSPARSI